MNGSTAWQSRQEALTPDGAERCHASRLDAISSTPTFALRLVFCAGETSLTRCRRWACVSRLCAFPHPAQRPKIGVLECIIQQMAYVGCIFHL